MFMSDLPACMLIYQLCTYPEKPGVSPGTEVVGGYNMP